MILRNCARLSLTATVLMALAVPIARPASPVVAQSLCPSTTLGDPHPGPAVPFIGGDITTDTGAPIADASVLLLRCVLGVPLLADTTTTQSDGTYAFSDLSTSAEYVVFAPLTGALAGLLPTAATHNPSWLIDGANGDADVDMAFE